MRFMNNKQLLQAISLDLKRAAIGFHSNSQKMAERFLQESIKRIERIDTSALPQTLRKTILTASQKLSTPTATTDEDALTYSTILLSFSKQL